MKKLILPLVIAASLLLSAFIVLSINWKIADGYSIKFTSDDPSGAFTSLKGDIAFDPNDLAGSKVKLVIDVSSIATGNMLKNYKAKGENWFNVDKYPNITFTSSKFAKTDKGYEVTGIMEVKDVKKTITIPFTFANKTFTSSFMINRIDYHVGDDVGMDAHAVNDLKIDVSIPVTQQ